MTPEMLERLDPFRDAAIERGIPVGDVERWIGAAARPCATLSLGGDGPVVGRFGGPLMLPPDLADSYYPFLASIDCAALPKEATDLPLPPDGRLLLFAFAGGENTEGGGGRVGYVASGAGVEEREEKHDFVLEEEREVLDQYPQGELHLRIDISLPSYTDTEIPDHFWRTLVREHPHAAELGDVWHDGRWSVVGALQLGGYPTDEYGGGGFYRKSPVGEDNRDWVLLADWHTDIEGVEGLTVHWPIHWSDLAARRFDQADATIFWNP